MAAKTRPDRKGIHNSSGSGSTSKAKKTKIVMSSIALGHDHIGNGQVEASKTQDEHRLATFKLKTISSLGNVKADVVMGPVGNYAKYDTQREKFALSANLTSNKSFAIEQTTMLSGSFKGYQALILVPVPTEKFPFLELPAELRNLIYHALLAPDGHEIVLQGAQKNSYKARLLPKTHRDQATPLDGSINGILSVSKEVHIEAMSVLYGCNKINARGGMALKWFLNMIGRGRAYLREIHIDTTHTYYLHTALRHINASSSLLLDAHSLTHFDISGVTSRAAWGSPPPEKGSLIASSMYNFIQMLSDRGKDESEILEVIRLVRSLCPEHRRLQASEDSALVQDCDHCKQLHKSNEQSYKQFKADVSEDLVIMKNQAEARLVAEQETREAVKKAKRKHGVKVTEPILRRDTGRPKRQSVAALELSYAEFDEESDEEEDADDQDDHEDD